MDKGTNNLIIKISEEIDKQFHELHETIHQNNSDDQNKKATEKLGIIVGMVKALEIITGEPGGFGKPQ